MSCKHDGNFVSLLPGNMMAAYSGPDLTVYDMEDDRECRSVKAPLLGSGMTEITLDGAAALAICIK